MSVFLPLLFIGAHPYYVSVTDIKYNEAKKTLEISCKLFTNDLEDALKRTTKSKVDIINPADRKATEKILDNYIQKRLIIKLNKKTISYTFVGYEKEEDLIWAYFEFYSKEPPKTLEIDDKILYDFLKEQINLVHATVGDKKLSYKVSNPDGAIKFEF